MLLSDAGLVQRQKEAMVLQDVIIQDIGKGVDRLHDQVCYCCFPFRVIIVLCVTF